MKKIKVLAIIGPAGSGKNTLLETFKRQKGYCSAHNWLDSPRLQFENKFHFIIPYTTRPMRGGEINGIDYWFLKEEDWAANDFVQFTEFRGWKYGFAANDFIEDKVNIGIFNPAAVKDLQQIEKFSVTVAYISTPGFERIERQLNREDYPDKEEVKRRYDADNNDFSYYNLKPIKKMFEINNSNTSKRSEYDWTAYDDFVRVVAFVDKSD